MQLNLNIQMKKYKLVLLFCSLFFLKQLNAQDSLIHNKQRDITSIGLGVGLDFGGIGYNFLVYPIKNIGLFAGAGYAIAGFGWNAGAKVLFESNKADYETKLNPYALAMYGYNAGIIIIDHDEYNKVFYGYTIGFGVDYHPKSKKDTYWSFAILYPFRSQSVEAYKDELTNNLGATFGYMFPVTISISSRLILNRQNKKNKHNGRK